MIEYLGDLRVNSESEERNRNIGTLEELVEVEKSGGALLFFSHDFGTNTVVTVLFDIRVENDRVGLISFTRFEYYPFFKDSVCRYERLEFVNVNLIFALKVQSFCCKYIRLDGRIDFELIDSIGINKIQENINRYGRFIINNPIKSLIESFKKERESYIENIGLFEGNDRTLFINSLFSLKEDISNYFLLIINDFNMGSEFIDLDVYVNLTYRSNSHCLYLPNINFKRFGFRYKGLKCLGMISCLDGSFVRNTIYMNTYTSKYFIIHKSTHLQLENILNKHLSLNSTINVDTLKQLTKEFIK